LANNFTTLHQPSVAVVILNWNGKNYLEKFLPFLLNSSYAQMQVVIADNGSTDDSLPFLAAKYPQLRVLKNPTNEGFANGYNHALQHVEAEYFVLLNSDVEVTANWLEPLVNLLESNPAIAAAQPKLLDYNKRNFFEYAGGAGGWLDKYGYPFCKGRIFEYCEEDHGQYEQTGPIFWASGAAMFIRSKIFREMNGFDGYFFAHQEEIDLCWRIQLAGYKIFSCPASVVYHVGGGTLPKGSAMKIFLNYRNNLVMLSKNMRGSEKFWKIPYRVGLDIISALKNLFTGNTNYFLAVMKGHFAYFGWLLGGWRKSVFPLTKALRPEGVYPGNAVWEYFVMKKKLFSEIVDTKS
jgi:GT2 family glycosyltransferase